MTKEEKEKNQQLYNEFVKEFKRAQNNAVYFMEHYYNKVYPDKSVVVDDEDRQNIYNKFKIMVPLMRDFDDFQKFEETKKRREEKGIKDWEYED